MTRSLPVFAVTLAASLLVTGFAAYGSDAWDPAGLLLGALVIAVAAAAAAGWPARPAAASSTATAEPPPADELPGAGPDCSLEAQGITARLLELIALGDRYGNVFALALVSVDYLDEVRSRYGDEVADRLLEAVAGSLAQTLRMPDRLGRFDDGVYLVVLPETDLPGGMQIAERLRAAVAALDVAVSSRLHVHTTASVGVTTFRRGDDLRGLLERAQRTLHGAQKQGRNRVVPDLAA